MKLDLLVVEVTPLMVMHVAFGSKCLPTALNAAFIRAFVSVDPHVDSEILFLTEGLLTAREWTLEGLRPIVQLHVLQQL